MQELKDKKILLGITGSIAAYKSAHLTRLFIKAGAEVKVIMTESAQYFISALTLSTLSKNEVYKDIAGADSWNNHVDLGLWADAFVIAPLTANSLSKLANGLADNMLVAAYLSARCPVFLAPAMDLDMWKHHSTIRNLNHTVAAGDILIPVGHGELASGLVGDGRMAEPEGIVRLVASHFSSKYYLEGKKILITAGPTQEKIDPVRYIGNHSSGKMGIALADKAIKAGAIVDLILGPVKINVPEHPRLTVKNVESADEMCEATRKAFIHCDAAILAAAVADYKPARPAAKKLKKQDGNMTIELTRTPDIAMKLKEIRDNQKVVGFALETDNEHENAIGKLHKKGFDFIVLNSLKDEGAAFGHDTNKVKLIFKQGREVEFPLKMKKEVAEDILKALAQIL